jgi:hypothetical protein
MDDVTERSKYRCGVETFREERGGERVTGLGTPDYNKF